MLGTKEASVRAFRSTSIALVLASCGSLEEDLAIEPGALPPEHRPAPVYEELFPYYIELLAVSQYRALDGFVGGTPGHAVLYLHGAEREAGAPYPRVRLCDPERAGPTGVGVSVNRWFRNVSWIAVPERSFFLHGDLQHGDRVTHDALEETARDALELGLFEGIELHTDFPTEGPTDLDYFVRHHSLGSDFALTMARSALGVRIPVTREQMGEVVVFLNHVNRQYAEGDADYEWSGYNDNCAHLLHNALAAAGVCSPKTVGHFKSSLSVPANELLDLLDRVSTFPLHDVQAVLGDPVAHDALLEYGWLPRRHGALFTTFDVHPDNEVFDPTFRLFVLESSNTRREEELVRDEHLLDLERNLRWFQDHYRELLAARPADAGEALRGDRERTFRRRYYAYLERMLEDVRAHLEALERAEAPAVPSGGLRAGS